ncbi:hypothetical protein RD1_3073 [Roseobacter denitrificans OCh 114]|uniref:Uncharacterized protein n=1 Tax=Roseobacter denitrificans (strain ATCC 33942 / OCh 114) TaxID=375451 RepID=Q164K9_ROSDO|nr:hypothetical protein RD1_3073 [Roseobacter denitrificans OCh 114]
MRYRMFDSVGISSDALEEYEKREQPTRSRPTQVLWFAGAMLF